MTVSKVFLLTLLWIAFGLNSNAQRLKIGDKIPEFNIGKLINYPKESIRFSDVKSRLVILDFWSTSCGSCISSMPHMDSLQKLFKEEILILPVTAQKEEIVMPFWDKNKYLNSTSLPTVVEDTLKKYFPYYGVPYHVWILDGKVFAQTNGETTNAKEIKEVLNGVAKIWPVADSAREVYDSSKILLLKESLNRPTPQSLFYSAILKGNPNYRIDMYDNFSDEKRSYTRVLYFNCPIKYLYINSLNLKSKIGVKYEVNLKQMTKWNNPKGPQELVKLWTDSNSYCYEMLIPGKIDRKQIGEYMLADLNKFFGYKGRIELRKNKDGKKEEVFVLTDADKIN